MKWKWIVPAALVLTTGALAQDKKPGKEPEHKPGAQMSDSDFMTKTATTNQIEIAMGRLAGTQSMNVDVKAFGKKMVTDHEKLNADLTSLAARKKIKLPEKLGEADQKMVDDMSKVSGDVFDRRYVDHMVSGHQNAVEMFKKTAADAKDADVKAFAAGALPKLEEHLKEARELQTKIGGTPEKKPPQTEKPKPGEPEKPKPNPPDKPKRPDRP
jgi:putative membrane protein